MVAFVIDAKVPHFAFPFHLEDGRAAVVEQDSVDDVATCVEVLLRTNEGERLEVPEYGLRDLVFQVGFDHPAIRAEIERWEPRASVVIDSAPDVADDLIRRIGVRLSVVR